MLKNKKILIIFLLFFIVCLSGCFLYKKNINLIDIKMATGIDAKLMPVNTTLNFSEGTSKVFCWFKWQGAKINTEIVVRWHYLTDDIHIYDYSFKIPRREGTGSVSLAMPQGKIFPPGSYRVDLTSQKHILKSLTFNIGK